MAHQIIQGNCLEVLGDLPPTQCLFADPFDNLGMKYNGFVDKMPHVDYIKFLRDCVYAFADKSPTVWISFYVRYTVEMGEIVAQFLRDKPDCECKPCVQVFTFGQHQQRDLGNNHRPLWRLKHKDAPLYPDQIRVESWRQRNGDKRADPRGRVPGDVLDFQYPEPGTVFDFPRVTGNSSQRCDWSPTQLHEGLVERCIKLSTLEGDSVIDPFGGSGTTLRVCERINRQCTLIEVSGACCDEIRKASGVV